jgi:hypothetical protein
MDNLETSGPAGGEPAGLNNGNSGGYQHGPYTPSADGRQTPLRSEFEPALISPLGLHLTRALCRRGWDTWPDTDDADLLGQVEAATAWLKLCERTKAINSRAGTSYGLKHAAEAWAGRYISNGCLLMAARRLGFQMAGVEQIHWLTGADRVDCFNVFLNISTTRLRRRA